MNKAAASVLFLAAVLAGVAGCGPGASVPAEKFYAGKVISFYVGGGPGGGFDMYARTISPYLTKYIPGHPKVIVENMAGAGSLPMLRTMESRAPQDGTVIGMFVSTAVSLSMLDPVNMGFDFTKLHYLGNMSGDFGVCFSWRGRGISSLDALRTEEVSFGDTSIGGGSYVYSSVLRHLFGSNVKHVLGYVTTQDVYLALERGEVEANCNGYSTLETLKPDWLANNSIQFFVKFSETDIDALKDVPNLYDLDIPEDTKKAIRFVLSFVAMNRPMVTTPGTPPDRVAVLREAFDKAIADPEFLAEAKQRKIKIAPQNGIALEAAMKEIQATPPEIVALARKMAQ